MHEKNQNKLLVSNEWYIFTIKWNKWTPSIFIQKPRTVKSFCHLYLGIEMHTASHAAKKNEMELSYQEEDFCIKKPQQHINGNFSSLKCLSLHYCAIINFLYFFVKNMQIFNPRVNDLDPESSTHLNFLFNNASKMFSM